MRSVGYIDEKWKWQFDYDLFRRICTRYPYAHLPRQVASVRVSRDSLAVRWRPPVQRAQADPAEPQRPSIPSFDAILPRRPGPAEPRRCSGQKGDRSGACRGGLVDRAGVRGGEAGGVPPRAPGARRRVGGATGRIVLRAPPAAPLRSSRGRPRGSWGASGCECEYKARDPLYWSWTPGRSRYVSRSNHMADIGSARPAVPLSFGSGQHATSHPLESRRLPTILGGWLGSWRVSTGLTARLAVNPLAAC